MADRSLNALMERLGFSGDGTPHGMRATFSTHSNAAVTCIDVIEHCLPTYLAIVCVLHTTDTPISPNAATCSSPGLTTWTICALASRPGPWVR